jgi:hypothetical protein
VTGAYYCGRCNMDWSVESSHVPERRRDGERRKRRLDALLNGLPRKPAPALLRTKPDRRTNGSYRPTQSGILKLRTPQFATARLCERNAKTGRPCSISRCAIIFS